MTASLRQSESHTTWERIDDHPDAGRFIDDPLASGSERFPLAFSGLAELGEGGQPSSIDSRPFGLRVLRVMGPGRVRPWRYCHVRQLTLRADGTELPSIVDKLEWTTNSHNDGDEGPSKDYGWETVPDDDPEK